MDGGIRVPALMRWPGHVTPGIDISEPISNMDLMPTLAEIMDQSLPTDKDIDGKSLLSLLTGKTKHTPHDFLFHYCTDKLHAVRWRPKEGKSLLLCRQAKCCQKVSRSLLLYRQAICWHVET